MADGYKFDFDKWTVADIEKFEATSTIKAQAEMISKLIVGEVNGVSVGSEGWQAQISAKEWGAIIKQFKQEFAGLF
jgi:hypothetical protein